MSATPLCQVFGECGGCEYQDLVYEDELKLKQNRIEDLFKNELDIYGKDVMKFIVPSPQDYHYRNRLDIKLQRTLHNGILGGYTPKAGRGILPIEECPIARKEISDSIPAIKKLAIERLPDKYRQASLVIRSGDEKIVHWGGIGRRSLRIDESDYFWTDIRGRKVFYSLGTFFQANLFILDDLFKVLHDLPIWNDHPQFLDLYGGVGLFSLGMIDKVGHAYLIESDVDSLALAEFNKKHHQLDNLSVLHGPVEDHLDRVLNNLKDSSPVIAMIDPPRAGLSDKAREDLSLQKNFDHIVYLSCHPDTLVRDLKMFVERNWSIERVQPFDFFPKTRHLETLVWLTQKN